MSDSNGKVPNVGDAVIYVDPCGRPHNALLTAVHGSKNTWAFPFSPCVNLVWVSKDENRHDGYGRQIERQSSITHCKSPGIAHGNYYHFVDEMPRPINVPV